MSDLISRQAAIDALKEHRALYCDNIPDTFSKLSYAEKSRVDELDMAIATLINLPSAQLKTGEWISKEDFATLCICAIRYCQGRRTYMPRLVQGIVRSHFGDIPDNDLGVMLNDCESQRTMDLYGDEQIDKPNWLRWEQDLKDEIERRNKDVRG